MCVGGGGGEGVKVDKRIMRLRGGGGGSYKMTEMTEGGYVLFLFVYLFIYLFIYFGLGVRYSKEC